MRLNSTAGEILEQQSLADIVARAEQCLLNEEWPAALDLFNQVLAVLGPQPTASSIAEVANAQNGRGVALLELGRYAEAVKALETAVSLEPTMVGAFVNLGLSWEGLGHAENALYNYSRAIELEPHDAEVYFRRGGIWFAMEEFEKTVEDATQAIDLHRDQGDTIVTGPYIARGLARHRLEHYDLALADYSQAAATDPRGAAEAFFYRALVYMDKGDALSARADLQAYLMMTDDLDGLLAEQAREIIEELDKQE